MPEIALNDKQKAQILKRAEEMIGKTIELEAKCAIDHDLMVNYVNGEWVVTNAHTGDEFLILNK